MKKKKKRTTKETGSGTATASLSERGWTGRGAGASETAATVLMTSIPTSSRPAMQQALDPDAIAHYEDAWAEVDESGALLVYRLWPTSFLPSSEVHLLRCPRFLRGGEPCPPPSAGKKTLGLVDLRRVFLSLGKDLSQTDLQNLCVSGTSLCNYDTYMSYLTRQPQRKVNMKEVETAILTLSKSSENGRMTTSELRLLMTSQGEKLSHEEAALLVSDADPRGTGVVDVDSFVRTVGGGK
jgi:Ca2+-binding EF-hand superfamily protein